MFSEKIWQRLRQKFKNKDRRTAVVLARQHHDVSRNLISKHALKVLYRLRKAGFAAFLVGGSVRDILLQIAPKDFDVATDARPEQIHQLFRNSRIIGRRFRLVHIFFVDEIIEVSTFRASSEECENNLDKKGNLKVEELPTMISSDNTYGTIEEDAWRRDFTVNALYYNIEDFSVIDYTGGMLDLQQRKIRMIGDPKQRYHEDPVRLLRAIRLAAKLDFKIEEHTEKPLIKLGHLLHHVPPSRLFDEILKLFFKGYACVTYQRLDRYEYTNVLFPATKSAILKADDKIFQHLIELACQATDRRISEGMSVNPGFLFAILLWPALQSRLQEEKEQHPRLYQAMHAAIEHVIKEQVQIVMIPKRFSAMIRSIWLMQYHLISRRGKRVWRSFNHRYFRAAYDFLELRAQAGEPYQEIVDWWSQFQKAKRTQRHEMIEGLE